MISFERWNWRLIGRGLRLSYLLRVPLLTLLVLAAFGPVSLNNDLLANLLDQQGNPQYLFLVSLFGFLLAFTAVTTLNLILHYGRQRFEGSVEKRMRQRRPLLVFFSGVAAATMLDVDVYVRTIPRQSGNIFPLTLGALGALALVFLSKVVQLALTDPSRTPHPPPFLVFPAYLLKPLERFFDHLYCWSSSWSLATKRIFSRLTEWPLEILRPAGQGYLVTLHPKSRDDLNLLSGHVFALSLFILAFGFYLGIAGFKSTITTSPAIVPALAFVLLFLIVQCWALSGLAFFFDRYRFPILWVLFALGLITANSPQSDHFFRVEKSQAELDEPPTPAAYLEARPKRKRLIFIATPGGGIQAAAWTGRVLQGLEEAENEKGRDFRNSVALISSVSGGSLGAMIYGASFPDNDPNTKRSVSPAKIAENAMAPAIDEVAWGWTAPDFWRAVIPWFRRDRTIDRGWALEKKWAAVNRLNDAGGEAGTMFSDWAKTAGKGEMPAIVMNSMLVESGSPVVFSNTRFPDTRLHSLYIRNFNDLYGEAMHRYIKIRVNTAARLSASFSYVAPAARPNLEAPFGRGYHFVDGGYFDNYGINSLLAWLKEALDDVGVQALLANPQEDGDADVLILQIQHFTNGDPTDPASFPGPSRAGWGLQLIAPGVALYNMRNYAQAASDASQLKFFAQYYESKHIHIWKTRIEYKGEGGCRQAPLSWKLDADQKCCVVRSWAEPGEATVKALNCIHEYLAGEREPAACDTAAKGS